MSKDIDAPVAQCPKCGLDIWESMLSGRWLTSCHCREAHELCKPKNKAIEDKWRKQ